MKKGKKRRRKQKRAAPIKEKNYQIEQEKEEKQELLLQEKLQVSKSKEKIEEEQQWKSLALKQSIISEKTEETFGQIVQRFPEGRKKKQRLKETLESGLFTEEKERKETLEKEKACKEKRRKRLRYRQKAIVRKTVNSDIPVTESQKFSSESDSDFSLQYWEDTKLFSIEEKESKRNKNKEKQQNTNSLKEKELSRTETVFVDKKKQKRKQQKRYQREIQKGNNVSSEISFDEEEKAPVLSVALDHKDMTVTSRQIVQRLEKEEKTEQEIAFFPEDKEYGRIEKSLDQKESKQGRKKSEQGDFLEEKENVVPLLISVQDTRRKRMLRKQREVMQRELAKQRKKEKTYPQKEICKTEESFTNFYDQKTEDFFNKDNFKEELLLSLTSEENNPDFSEEKDFFEQEVVENKNTIKNSIEKNTYDLSEMEIEKRKNEKDKKKILYKKRKQENRQKERKSYQKEQEQKINQKNKEKTSQTKEELKTNKNTEFIKEATNATNTSDFFPSKKLEALQEKAEKIEKQVEKAQRKLKRKKEYKLTRVWKESSGKVSYVLTVTEVEKQPVSKHLWKQGIHWIESQGNAYIHGKIAEAEQENSAVEAAHKTEQLAETMYGYANSHRKTKEQRQRETLQKLQKKQEKAERKVSYQQYLEEHPEISKKEIRKRMQKAQRKKEYQKIRHQAERIKEGKEATFKAGDTIIELISWTVKSSPLI